MSKPNIKKIGLGVFLGYFIVLPLPFVIALIFESSNLQLNFPFSETSAGILNVLMMPGLLLSAPIVYLMGLMSLSADTIPHVLIQVGMIVLYYSLIAVLGWNLGKKILRIK
jgi:Sec-independent protein secretion pathway component TatC